MLGLLPVIFALAIIDSARGDALLRPLSWQAWCVLFSGSLTAWGVICELVSGYLVRRTDRRFLEWWDHLAQALVLVWFGVVCFRLGWKEQVHASVTASILPWLAMQMMHWWCLAGGDGEEPGAHAPGRSGFVLDQLRFGMLQLLLLLPVFDVCNFATQASGLQPWLIGHLGLPVTMFIGSMALWGAGLLVLPGLMPWLWRTRPLPSGTLADELWAAIHRTGIRVRSLRIWPAEGGRAYNAVLNGVLPFMRNICFSEELVRDLPRPQLMAVLGHELGHARNAHLLLYYLFFLATGLVALLLTEPLARELAHCAWCRTWPSDVRTCSVSLVLVAIEFRMIWGYLSRACERQADLVGVELCGDPRVMRAALRSVARHNGMPEDAPSWAHYSIQERAAFLERVAADPGQAARHHQVVARWWYVVAPLVLALACILVIMARRTVRL